MKYMSNYLLVLCLLAVCGCGQLETPPNKTQPDDGESTLSVPYKVVAHRGGYLECGRPDCSIASLMYAISLKCYASECDVVITKDNEVLVAHPQNGYLVNGLAPFEHSVEELRAAGKLPNDEPLPTLRDFLAVIVDKDKNPLGMKLQLDIKRLLKDGKEIDVSHSINVCMRACEIIQEMNAEEYCEILIPTGDDIFSTVRDEVIERYKISLSWATCTNPSRYGKAGAQLAYAKIFGDTATYGPMDYVNAGIPLVVYNVDDDETMDTVIPFYPKLRAIFTNYPKMLIEKLKEEY